MKKILIAILAATLFYSFFRNFNFMQILLVLACSGAIYGIYRLPSPAIAKMKYPLIVLSFLVTILFFVYPRVPLVYPARIGIVFVSFYSIIFYLLSVEEKQTEFFKEITAISILFVSSALNLFMVHKLLFIVSFAAALVVILFILDRIKMIPFIILYAAIAAAILYKQGGNILNNGFPNLGNIDKYILLSSSFIFLVMSFILFTKKSGMVNMLPFFGFLYIALDILMVLGLKLSTGLLYQPVIFLIFAVPLVGIMLKAEGGRT